ncbi:MAG: phosphate acetyltransferase [Bacteroidales bacterium]|nr:phosphate acetyltransferase [Paludibacteraceae bacterium]MCI7728997.1 phosphate acetyltransferase [Bacteroidales bacterium]MDD5974683.1 phosphate acetyltransferase [Bacteroidales bacterium]MDY5193277.1 phosphate acetyltransferase [Candidatus Aphodosoma sp.]
MKLLQEIKERAQSNPQRIVLPEGDEPRTLEAANTVIKDKVANIILLGNPEKILALAAEKGFEYIKQATIIDPDNNPELEKYAEMLCEIRKKKGMTMEEATRLAKDPLYLGCLMIKAGAADGELAGARNATGDVLRPALQIVRTKPGMTCVSGALMLFSKAKEFGEDGMIMVADVAVMPNPTAAELAQIAVATGHTMRAIAGKEPRIAMLSFSTKGSAKHELVDKVTEATRLAKEMEPDMMIDGELQADAALVPSVGEFKAPGSKVAGHANTLVFPSLEVGNIGYKMVQRLGGAEAIGPVLQGMAAPINDLSRGCSVSDIEMMIAITCNQAIAAKK